jgi:serine protease Do
VVVTDPEHDIALIHLTQQPTSPLKALPVANDTLSRGVEVAVFGFPLGDELGGGVKLTKGIVTALPDKARENMYLLDVNVNHGNSGGPLCDRYGRVVGLISARTIGGEDAGSYGMALPTPTVFDFIKPKLPALVAGEKKGPKLDDWSEVDKVVSPSVVMILKKR